MSRGLRILHVADSHIGAQLPARPRDAAAWRRGDDFVASFERALARAREFDVDLILHAGDLFDEASPSDSAIAAAATPLLELAAAGIPIVIVPGNHERSAIPAALLLQHPNLHILAAPGVVRFALRGLRVAVAGAPCVRRRSATRYPSAINATGWEAKRGDVNILLAHQTFESATCGPANFRFRSGEDVVERSVVPAGFQYVVAGHIHRHQSLASPAAPIVYSGSVDRISFAEEHEAKGCVLIEEVFGELKHRFVAHPVRAMAKLPLDVTGRTRRALRDEVLAWAGRLPQEALAQVRMSGRAASRELRGIALAAQVAEIRPDLRLEVASQAVEFVPERAAPCEPVALNSSGPPQVADKSAFATLREESGERVTAGAEQVGTVPTGFGVYAFFDNGARLLYVGKATNVRARVRQHLSARPNGAFFEGWTSAIARIEVRPAYSELEALLVEAELIRLVRPPFNRQMRQWERYCYLCAGERPYGELTIVRDLPEADARGGLRFYGPYRSRSEAAQIAQATAGLFGLALCRPLIEASRGNRRTRQRIAALPVVANLCDRYFASICAGPCGGRAERSAYASAVERRSQLLRGKDDSSFAAAELELAERVESSEDELSPATRAAVETYQVLRHAYEHGRLVAEAEALMETALRLPGAGGGVRVVRLGVDGLVLGPDVTHAAFTSARNQITGQCDRPIPKAMLDAFCTAARYLRREMSANKTATGS